MDKDAGSSKVRSLVSAARVSVGALMMSMIRDVKVAWRFVRPPQTMIVTRSADVQYAINLVVEWQSGFTGSSFIFIHNIKDEVKERDQT